MNEHHSTLDQHFPVSNLESSTNDGSSKFIVHFNLPSTEIKQIITVQVDQEEEKLVVNFRKLILFVKKSQQKHILYIKG